MVLDHFELHRQVTGSALPASDDLVLDWTGFITKDESRFLGGGSFGDVYVSKWTSGDQIASSSKANWPEFAVKVLRASVQGDEIMRGKRNKVELSAQRLTLRLNSR
jgi:hypothetical protein